MRFLIENATIRAKKLFFYNSAQTNKEPWLVGDAESTGQGFAQNYDTSA